MVGNSTELKNVILFDNVRCPTTTMWGIPFWATRATWRRGCHLQREAGQDPRGGPRGFRQLETGLKKFGAMLGDHVEVGCNSVLNPGTVVGRGSHVYPLP